MGLSDDTKGLVAHCLAIVRETRERMHASNGWQHLQIKDADGNIQGMVPYTDEAIESFESAHARAFEDIETVHHLAIAHHARAWDWEIQGDARAPGEWARALGYWRKISSNGPYWEGMKQKLERCEPDGDSAIIDRIKENLLKHLLEVHVDYVRVYCEREETQRALDHVEIVRRAEIPPALKKQLEARVFDAMMGSAGGDHDSALAKVERFLEIYPANLPALRMHAEISRKYIEEISCTRDWEAIKEVSKRALPRIRGMNSHKDLANDAMAKAAMDKLAVEVSREGLDKGQDLIYVDEGEEVTTENRDAAVEALGLAIDWCKIAYPHSPGGSRLKIIYNASLKTRAYAYNEEVLEVANCEADIDVKTRLDTMAGLLQKCLDDLKTALAVVPDDEKSLHNIEYIEGKLEETKRRSQAIELEGI
jgi:tetratricopeptide (TPR) repeat protein